MEQQIKNIKEKLTKLKKLDRGLKVFGAKEHQYILNKCLTEKQIVKIEKKYNIILPEEYRFFLKEVGNGGAGPFYGLYSLKEGIEELYGKKDLLSISDPFILKKDWLDTKKALKEYLQEKDRYQLVIEDWIKYYGKNYKQYFYDIIDREKYFSNYKSFGTNHLIPLKGKLNKEYLEYAYCETVILALDKGTLRLAHIGSGSHNILVISGNKKGTVWAQFAPSYKQIDNSFLNWYEDWLNKALISI